MDFNTILGYVVFFVETAALLGAFLFVPQATKAGKNSPDRKAKVTKAIACLTTYLILNAVRTSMFGG